MAGLLVSTIASTADARYQLQVLSQNIFDLFCKLSQQFGVNFQRFDAIFSILLDEVVLRKKRIFLAAVEEEDILVLFEHPQVDVHLLPLGFEQPTESGRPSPPRKGLLHYIGQASLSLAAASNPLLDILEHVQQHFGLHLTAILEEEVVLEPSQTHHAFYFTQFPVFEFEHSFKALVSLGKTSVLADGDCSLQEEEFG